MFELVSLTVIALCSGQTPLATRTQAPADAEVLHPAAAPVCTRAVTPPRPLSRKRGHSGGKQQKVILMISDGCGFNHVKATDYFQHGEEGVQVYERGFEQVAMTTYPAGGSYSPGANWADFNTCKEGATDSAAAATALGTGAKTYNGAIGVDPNKVPLVNVVEVAEAAGRATGVVTTVQLSHATPAGFVAHNESRKNYAEIANEMFLWSSVDVIMGGGNPWFDADGKFAPLDWAEAEKNGIEPQYAYVGGFETWTALVTGQAGGDADGDGADDPWTLLQTRDEFEQLALGAIRPTRVAGVFRSNSTTQQKRTGVDDEPKDDSPYQTYPNDGVPTLSEMSLGALNVLGTDPDGFFLMIEGGAIDWASHANQLGRMIEEQIDFNLAVETVVKWIEANGGWEEALLVITADHECGYLTGANSDPKWGAVVSNGRGRLPGAEFHSGSHTNSLVPLYARGAGSELIVRHATKHDPICGACLDSAALGRVLLGLMK